MFRPPPSSTLFPYTTLFRSFPSAAGDGTYHFYTVATDAAGNTEDAPGSAEDRKSTRLNSSHRCISYAVFCLKKKKEHGSGRYVRGTSPICHKIRIISGSSRR